MAKKKVSAKYENSYEKATRNRGNDFSEPKSNLKYDYMPADQYEDRSQERAIRRKEVRETYQDLYELNQRRDQRAYARLTDMENEFYAGIDPLRRKEMADGGMIREDHTAMANLPRQAVHCEFPHAGFYESNYIDSGRRGVNKGLDDNGGNLARFLDPRDLNNSPT